MKTLIIGIPNLKEIENDQMFGTAKMAKFTEEIVNYIGARHCDIGDLDLEIHIRDISLTQSDRAYIQSIVGNFANLIFFEGDPSTYMETEGQTYYCVINPCK